MNKPILAIGIRTQGDRNNLLKIVLENLAAQTDQRFRIYLAIHTQNEVDYRETVDQISNNLQNTNHEPWIGWVSGGGRARPLNVILSEIQEDLVVFLDDDDEVFPNWTSNYLNAFEEDKNRIIRCFVRSEIKSDFTTADVVSKDSGGIGPEFVDKWNLIFHSLDNQTPFMGFAVPTSVIKQNNMQFNEDLEVLEDWEFLMNAVQYVPVFDTEMITATYNLWQTNRSLNLPNEIWTRDRSIVREIISKSIYRVSGEQLQVIAQQQNQYHQELKKVIDSKDYLEKSKRELEFELKLIRNSKVWKLANLLRKLKQKFNKLNRIFR